MDLKQIEYFLRVAERRSFSRAAEMLDVAQPTLSRQVRLLEQELGQHLLYRNGRGVEPTEAGLRFVEHARALLALAERAREDLRSLRETPAGKVSVGLPPRIARVLTPPLVQAFRRGFPDASIAVAEGLSAQVREWLLAGRVDLALLYDPAPSPQLAYESLFREDLVLVAAAGRQPPLPPRVRVAELPRYPLVLPSLPNAIRTLVESSCRAQGLRLTVAAEVDAVQTIVELAAQGDAYAILPRSAVVGPAAEHTLSLCEIEAPRITNNLVLASARHRPATRLASATADLIRGLGLAALFAPPPAVNASAPAARRR
ncbi:LysR family transcriptional regulator [Achromobacter sp. Marseille-Q0513]|uniref:LysR family transcriptional regulator n=1 Tax=Achromobacter sp. Marseille-Q0513 TaxID=2829161 RepID=UPI001B9E9AA0|nr:LysR substrate-binding domain-containing protein [Achromobacter sp. Marseille-Q0513]MBR8656228.1 LysR family transcriptional regulator [Achromobacter sp. Marseille-Q0513]